MTQQLMSPTYPITTWSPSRRTFWTESLVGPHLPRPLTAGSAPAAGAPLLPQAGVGGCLCGDGAREPWVSCQWSSGAFWSEGRPQGLPQAGARSPGLLLLCSTPPARLCLPGTHSPPVCGRATSACRTRRCQDRHPGPGTSSFCCDCFLGRSPPPGAVPRMAARPPLTPHHSLTRQARTAWPGRWPGVAAVWTTRAGNVR